MFERQGLIVATENDRLLGFAHAGFGPTEDGEHLATTSGATCALMVRPLESPDTLAGDLLSRSEEYLKQKGAQTLLAGGIDRWGPFYLGLTGGSACSAVLGSDPEQQQFYLSHGYAECSRSAVMHCDLARFRQPIDRRLMAIRRRTQVLVLEDPDSSSWWESSTLGTADRTQFNLAPREGGSPLASITAWNMDLLGATWGVRAAGLVELNVPLAPNRRQGLGIYMVSEALRHLQAAGTMLAEAQVDTRFADVISLLVKLGFVEIDQAVRFRKVA
jgi:GNAT superfamily N-acetyltransferase